jgi:DNA ligase-1
MEQTSSRIALTGYLVALLKKTPADIIDKVTYLIQGKLYPDYEGIEMGIAEKMVLRAIASSSGKDISEIGRIYQKTGDLGEATLEVMKSKSQSTLYSEPMTVERVYSTFDKVARTTGAGSQEIKLRLISSLLNDAMAKEGCYIIKFVMGQLRLGIADYTVLDALAIAFTGDKANRQVLENAYNVSSDLGSVARLLATKGLEAVSLIKIALFKPIRPMLAERIRTAEEALERMGSSAAVEYKLDGERVQVHKGKDKVELFSRRLEKITSHYPDVANALKAIKAEVILEGEVVAVNVETEEFLPFQELMHRRRKYGVEEAMENQNNKLSLIKQTIATEPYEIDRFMAGAIENGCEGVMIKHLSSTYRAGAREYAWVKLKREYTSDLVDTLDLVIVGALHGRGRRVGKYGALLLAAYDHNTDMFRSVTKVGTGFTDLHIEQFYKELEKHIVSQRHARVDTSMEMDIWFEPKIVIEVIASEITLSPSHTAAKNTIRPGYGLALRFPKFTGKIRDDKKPEDATTIDEIVAAYKRQLKVVGQSGVKVEVEEEDKEP